MPAGVVKSLTVADGLVSAASGGTVDLADISSMTAARLLGRTSASSGIPQEITPGSGLVLSGTTLTAPGAAITAGTLLGRRSSSGGVPEEITPSTGLVLSGTTLTAPGPTLSAGTLLGRRSGSGGLSEEIAVGTGLSISGTTINSSAPSYTEGTWTPTFTNLTVIGGAPTITGRYTQIGRMVYFTIEITAVGTTASVAGTTFCDTPITVAQNNVCNAVDETTSASLGIGFVNQSANAIYPPSWGATLDGILISGQYEA